MAGMAGQYHACRIGAREGAQGPLRGKDRAWRGPLCKAAERWRRVVECAWFLESSGAILQKLPRTRGFPPAGRVAGPRGGPRLRELGRAGKISFSVFELIRMPLIFM